MTNEVEGLRAENARYRTALRTIATPVAPIHDETALKSWRIAHIALKPPKEARKIT